MPLLPKRRANSETREAPREWPMSWMEPSARGSLMPTLGKGLRKYCMAAWATTVEEKATVPEVLVLAAPAQSRMTTVSSLEELALEGTGPAMRLKLVALTP